MIKFLEKYPQNKSLYKKITEDLYLTRFISLLPGIQLPTYQIAKKFCTETDYYYPPYEVSAGIHRNKMTLKQWDKLNDLCLEFNMTHKYVHILEET